jgi:hypothetical protein
VRAPRAPRGGKGRPRGRARRAETKNGSARKGRRRSVTRFTALVEPRAQTRRGRARGGKFRQSLAIA